MTGPQGALSGPPRFALFNSATMERLRANPDYADWPEEALREDELVIGFGTVDEAGRRWSYVMTGAAFRAAIADGFGGDADVLLPSAPALVIAPGWPDDWDVKARAERAERAMARSRPAPEPPPDQPIVPVGSIRGTVTYVRQGRGPERAIVEGVDDIGRPWKLSMNAAFYRAAKRRAAYLQRATA